MATVVSWICLSVTLYMHCLPHYSFYWEVQISQAYLIVVPGFSYLWPRSRWNWRSWKSNGSHQILMQSQVSAGYQRLRFNVWYLTTCWCCMKFLYLQMQWSVWLNQKLLTFAMKCQSQFYEKVGDFFMILN